MPSSAEDHNGHSHGEMPSDSEITLYVADLLRSLQKLCRQRGMKTLSHFIGIARLEAIRLANKH